MTAPFLRPDQIVEVLRRLELDPETTELMGGRYEGSEVHLIIRTEGEVLRVQVPQDILAMPAPAAPERARRPRLLFTD